MKKEWKEMNFVFFRLSHKYFKFTFSLRSKKTKKTKTTREEKKVDKLPHDMAMALDGGILV